MYEPQELAIKKPSQTDDGIGGVELSWGDYITVTGYLDLVTGTDLPTGAGNNAFVETSTHVLVIPTVPTEPIDDSMRVEDGMARTYDITYVDNPVGVNHHLEVYLRYTGVTDNG